MAAARESADYVALDISYVYEGLLAYKVEKVDDLHQMAAEQRRANARSREDAKVKKFAEGFEGGAPQRPRSKSKGAGAPAKERARKAAPDAKDHGMDSGTDDCMSIASGSADSDFAGIVEAGVDEPSDCRGDEGRDHDPPVEPPPPPLPCRHDSTSGRVYGPGGAYWGRVSIVRPGQRSESLSVYCSRHGCTICKRVSANLPGLHEILKWFADGQSVPAGRTSGLQSHHKQMWP